MRLIRKIFITTLYLFVNILLFADNDSIIGNSPYLPGHFFFYEIYDNPAAHFKMPDPNQGKVEIGYRIDNHDKYHLLQEGTKENKLNILAEGFSVKGNQAYWGKAYYANTKTQDVQWSNLSDIFRLGPYLIADSIGGDTQGEEYYFTGGLSSSINKWTWGIEAAYLAKNSYRKVDPRPLTTTSDLLVNAGISYQLTNYQLGLTLSGGIYKQKLTTKVQQDKKTYQFYALTGFGMYNVEQSAIDRTFDWFYKGNSYGFNVFLFPNNSNGFLGNLEISHQYTDSYVKPNLSSIYPFTFSTNLIKGVFGYKTTDSHGSSQIKADWYYQTGKGTERIYEYVKINDTFYEYELISESKKYTRNILNFNLSGLKEWYSISNNRWIKSSIGFDSYEERYAFPDYHINYNHLSLSLNGGTEFLLKGNKSFLAEASVSYLPLISSEEKVPVDNRIFDLSVRPNLEILETSPIGANIRILYQFPIKKDIKLYVCGEGGGFIAENSRQRYSANLSVGFRY